jgi:hypothetical protein
LKYFYMIHTCVAILSRAKRPSLLIANDIIGWSSWILNK